jgi:hypothetical protein
MATSDFFEFHALALDLGLAKHNFPSHTLLFSLHTNSLVPSLSGDAVFADLGSEIAGGGGYTSGGLTLPVTSFTQTGGRADLVCGNVVLTATANIPAWRYVVLRNSTTSGEPLIGYGDYGAPVTILNGETFAFNFNYSSRLIRISVVD